MSAVRAHPLDRVHSARYVVERYRCQPRYLGRQVGAQGVLAHDKLLDAVLLAAKGLTQAPVRSEPNPQEAERYPLAVIRARVSPPLGHARWLRGAEQFQIFGGKAVGLVNCGGDGPFELENARTLLDDPWRLCLEERAQGLEPRG